MATLLLVLTNSFAACFFFTRALLIVGLDRQVISVAPTLRLAGRHECPPSWMGVALELWERAGFALPFLKAVRWRKADIDRLVKRLPQIPPSHSGTARPLLDDAQVERLADAISRKLERAKATNSEKLVSINKAAAMLGIGRTTTYRLIGTGQLTTRHIGRRTLVMRHDIDRILGEQPKPMPA